MSEQQYQEEIIRIIKTINDKKMLKFLYEIIMSFKEKWGI